MNKSFTLIELLVVLAILGIFAVLGFSSYMNSLRSGKDARRKTDLKAIQQALQQYYNKNGTYPTLNGTDTDTSLSLAWRDPANPNGLAYYLVGQGHITQLPNDPINKLDSVAANSTFYFYDPITVSGVAPTYELCTNLENDNDPERTSPLCSSGGDYIVTNP